MKIFSFFDKKDTAGFTQHHFCVKSGAGFTLIEIFVVISIVVLLSTLILTNTFTGSRSIEVRRSAQTISSALREAQNDALGSGETGVYFATGQNPILFVDADNDKLYDAGEWRKTVVLDKNTELFFSPPYNSPLHVFFAPPNPDVYLNGALISSDVLVTVRHINDTSIVKTIRINMIGLISIE